MNLKCAIVDDEPLALDLLESYVNKTPFLELAGKYSSAVQAMSDLPDKRVDLLFLDIQMPELNGIEATKRIRAHHGPSQRARIIAVSANADLDGPNGLASAGFDDTLMKPVTPTRLEFVIAAIAAEA